MPIESPSHRVVATSPGHRARHGTSDRRVAVAMRYIGLVVGILLLAAGAVIAVSALCGLYALPPAQDLARAGDDMATFRCGMPAAAAIVALMFSLPVAVFGGALTLWCRPERMQHRR